MEKPRNIKEVFTNKNLRIEVLEKVRPHLGALLPADVKISGAKIVDARSTIARLRGFDCLIVLLRQLRTYDHSWELGDELNTKLNDLVMANMGFELYEDWRIKGEFLGWMGIGSSKELGDLQFEEMIKSPEFKDIILDNPQFRVIDPVWVVREMGHMKPCQVERVDITSARFRDRNALIWDGSGSLEACINNQFRPYQIGEKLVQQAGSQPEFIKVLYEPRVSLSFASLQSFSYKARPVSLVGNVLAVSTQDRTFIICAIVRLGDGKVKDDIRIYGTDGSEAAQMKCGSEADKPGVQGWSVEKPGRYMLFYHRAFAPAGGNPMADLDPNGKERKVVSAPVEIPSSTGRTASSSSKTTESSRRTKSKDSTN